MDYSSLSLSLPPSLLRINIRRYTLLRKKFEEVRFGIRSPRDIDDSGAARGWAKPGPPKPTRAHRRRRSLAKILENDTGRCPKVNVSLVPVGITRGASQPRRRILATFPAREFSERGGGGGIWRYQRRGARPWCASPLVPGYRLPLERGAREIRISRTICRAAGESARRHDLTTEWITGRGARARGPSDSARRVSRRRPPEPPRRSPWRRRLPGDNRLPVHSARRYLCGMHRAPLLLETPRSRTCAFQWRRPEEINRWAAGLYFWPAAFARECRDRSLVDCRDPYLRTGLKIAKSDISRRRELSCVHNCALE